MSTKFNQELRFWKVVAHTVRRNSYSFRSSALSPSDHDVFCTGLELQCRLMSDTSDVGLSNDLKASIIRWLKAIAEIKDVEIVTSVFKEARLLICHNTEEQVPTYADFKRRLTEAYPGCGGLIAPIKRELEEFLQRDYLPAFASCYQFFTFLSHLRLRDIDLSQECLDAYMADESRLATLQYDEGLLNQLNAIMRGWFPQFSCSSEFIPGHGPGGVASHKGRPTKLEKYQALRFDARLEYFYKQIGQPCASDLYLLNGLDRRCEVVFVPKSMNSWRTISKEPASLQYLQHGQSQMIDRAISHHPYLRRIIDLHNQDSNRELAGKASATGSMATIDLSSASDSVSWELVKRVFAGTPILRMCYTSRSDRVLLPNGVELNMHKFAPMGSALCFPIECLVFACICEYVVRTMRLPGNALHYSVYGDDIVIDSEVAPFLLDTLSQLGFRANRDKSFFSPVPGFREACGGHFYKGVEVTPLIISRRFSTDPLFERINSKNGKSSIVCHPDRITQYISIANQACTYGYKSLRAWFISKLLDLPQRYRPLFSCEEKGVFSVTPTNFHLIWKYRQEWQADVVVCGELVTRRTKTSEEYEAIRYYEWLRCNCLRRTKSSFEEAAVAHIGASVAVWLPRVVSKS